MKIRHRATVAAATALHLTTRAATLTYTWHTERKVEQQEQEEEEGHLELIGLWFWHKIWNIMRAFDEPN